MSDIQVSIYGSCNRPHMWQWFYDNVSMNHINFQIIFVGNVEPKFTLPDNFHFIYSNVKPLQCMHIAANMCEGEVLQAMVDDCQSSPYSLDIMYELYKTQNNYKALISPKFFGVTSTPKDINELQKIADSTMNDVGYLHVVYDDPRSLKILPSGGMMSSRIFHELGGYDKRFIWGGSDLDLFVRAQIFGADVIYCENAWIVERKDLCPGWNSYSDKSKKYNDERLKLFRSLWFKDGIESIENFLEKRASDLDQFEDTDTIGLISQGPTGEWD